MSVSKALIKKVKFNFFNLGRLLSIQSRLKVFFIFCFTIVLIGGMWGAFYNGFRYFDAISGLGSIIIDKLFTFFFFSMGFMLFFSSIITSYSTIFRSEEIPFLLVRPLKYGQITLYKFLESSLLSSWAFVFVIFPFVGAYASYNHMSALFLVETFIFSIPFLFICSGLGSIFIIIFIRFISKSKKFLFGSMISLSLILIVWLIFNPVLHSDNTGVFNISTILPGLHLSANPLLPSYWTSEGIMALTNGQFFRGFMFFCLLIFSAWTMFFLINDIGQLLFYSTWLGIVEAKQDNKRASILFKSLGRFLFFLPHDIKAMIKKDIRIFFRDPVQWSQVLIFLGLMGLYFINLRNFNYHAINGMWKNLIAFLNVFCLSMVLSSLGSRFIYPQLSLEGQGFWVIGLAPTSMKRIVLTKFFSSLFAMMIISFILIMISSTMLGVKAEVKIFTIILILAVSIAVCGLSTGLGAIFIDLNQRNPAAIVSGFGGTLNLILNLGFMIITIIPPGLILHLETISRISHKTAVDMIIMFYLGLILITVCAGVVPLILGIRSISQNKEI